MGTLLGKIGTLMSKKETKILYLPENDGWKGTIKPEASSIISSIRNIIGQDSNKNMPKVSKNHSSLILIDY